MKRQIAFTIIAVLAMALTGCTNPVSDIIDPPVSGGKVDRTDPLAPKTIKSKDLVFFSNQFFLYGQYSYESDGFYDFEVKKNDDGTVSIEERSCYNVSCVTDEHILKDLQAIIDKHELAKANGVDKHTAGLPPEYQPMYFRANYGSGESIYFSENNDPDSPWEREILKLLGDEFAAHGEDCFQPPANASEISRFELEITDGIIRYRYGELHMPYEGVEKSFEELVEHGYEEGEYYTVIEKDPWDRSGKTEPETIYRELTPEYYKGLKEVLDKVQIINFVNDEQYPWEFDYEGTPDYYNFYIEFASGDTLYGFSDDKDQNMAFAPAAKLITKYIEDYIAEEPHTR